MVNGWKVAAIIFIIIITLLAGLIIWGYTEAMEEIEKEKECMGETCWDYEYYSYNTDLDLCTCYLGNEVAYQEFLD